MAFGDDGVVQAGGADWVVFVYGAVVEGAEPDGQASFAEHGSFDSCVATACLDCVMDVGEGLGDWFGAGAVPDRFAGLVGVVERSSIRRNRAASIADSRWSAQELLSALA